MAITPMSTFASRDVCDLVFCEYATKKPLVYVDYANTTALGLTGETVYAYGGHGHPKRVGFAGDRGGTITFETQVSTMMLYSLVTGGILSETADFMKREVLTATDGGLTLSDTPVAGSATVYADGDDCGTALETTVAGTAVTGTGITTGNNYIVYYMVQIATGVQKININGSSSPKEYTIYGYTTQRGEDGIDRALRMVCYKAMPQPTVDINFANNGDPSSLSVTFDLEADSNNNLMDLIYLDENA